MILVLLLCLLSIFVAEETSINCPLPNEWRYELTLTPTENEAAMTTDGKALIDGKEIYVACQISTWTFMNRFRNIQEHPELKDGDNPSDFWEKYYFKKDRYLMSVGDYIDSLDTGDDNRPPGSIRVQCKGGIFNPDIFTNFKNWCVEGCPTISQKWLVDTKKDVIYPKGSLSLDPFRAPVQRLPESMIELPCHFGFAATKDSKSLAAGTFCTTNGFQLEITKPSGGAVPGLTKCEAKCDNPKIAVPNSILSGNSDTSNYTYSRNQKVTLACEPGYQIYGSGYRKCIKTEEKWKDYYEQSNPYGTDGVYWDPPPALMYCHPLDPSLANRTEEENAAHHVQPARATVLFIVVTWSLFLGQVIQ
ncbi:hypothetical protein ACHWQZ_G017987 [Mnemiopsis leidyi]